MLRWLKRGLWTLIAFLTLGSVAGFLYQSVANRRDAARFHPPGRMIDIGSGRRLSLDCRGAGSPTVILESGLGGPAILWASVVKGIEPMTRVCAYDRAGYGYSDPGPDPRTANAIVDDLEKLLPNAGEPGPYLLLGHSLGGFFVRVFAARHLDVVAGLVLVDSSHPEQIRRMPETTKRLQNRLNWAFRLFPFMSRIGVVRAALNWKGAQYTSGWNAGPPGELTFLESQPKFAAAYLSELDSLEESATETMAASRSLGDLPLIVLTAGKQGVGDAAMYRLWRNELQPELVRLSSRGKQIVVQDSTHMIPMEKPQAVVDAVSEMLNVLRRQP